MSPTMASVLKLVHDNHEAAEEGHSRLRKDWRSLESRLIMLEQAHKEMVTQFSTVERRASDVSQLKLSPGMVVSIVIACMSIAGGVYAANSGLRSDVRDILTRMGTQADSIREMRAQISMQDVKINNLRELVLSNTTPNTRRQTP